MTRLNYHQAAHERFVAGVSTTELAARFREPLAVVAAALAIVLTAWSIEVHRIMGLDGELRDIQVRAHAAEADDARARRLTTAVARLRSVDERIALARREVFAVTNTIARIGNGLPPQTWLTSLASAQTGDWTIGGRSTRVDEVGTMLRRVQNLDRNATARLVSIAAGGRGGRILDFVIGWDHRP